MKQNDITLDFAVISVKEQADVLKLNEVLAGNTGLATGGHLLIFYLLKLIP